MSAEQQTNQRLAEDDLDQVLRGAVDGQRVAADLFGVADLLSDQKSLLRSLTDTGRAPEERVALMTRIIAPVCVAETVQLCGLLVSQHWTSPTALVETVNSLAIVALLSTAKAAGQLDQVEAELFAVSMLLAENRDLRIQLSELGAGTRDSRASLVEKILGDKVLGFTSVLVARAVKLSDHGRLLQTVRGYSREAARLNGARLVTVTTAQPLSEVQRLRLKSLVEKKLGQKITMATAVDSTLIGGYRLNFGDEAVDASIRSDLTEAKRALVR